MQTKMDAVKIEILVSSLHDDLPKHFNPHRDENAHEFLLGNHIRITEDPDMSAVEAQNHLICHTQSDYYLGLSDDVELASDALENAMACMGNNFPDGDGAVGIKTENIPHAMETCFMLMGMKFIERFDDRSPFCPEYRHFYADTELGHMARQLKRFKFCKESTLVHYHSETCNDQTHRGAKRFWTDDHNTYVRRQKEGKLWGLLK